MLILNSSEVRKALTMAEAITEMERAFALLARGAVELPQRTQLQVAGELGTSLIMSCYAADPDGTAGEALMVKVASVFPGNLEREIATINGAVLVLDPETGVPEAMMDGGSLTAIRTGAASGLATRLLAPKDARILAVVGAGGQARSQVAAVCAVRPINEVRVYSRTLERAHEMVEALAGESSASLRVVGSASEAIADADVICTATTSAQPVFKDGDLKANVHLNAVGAYRPDLAEIPVETCGRAFVVVDSLEAAREEAGELIQAVAAGTMNWEGVGAELGDLVLGRAEISQRPGVTLFKSVGLAVQDALAAKAALANARARGLGQQVRWE